jgi:small subunit ribosomal protein S2
VFVVDAINDGIAVKEAIKLDVPVIALVDTNADPSVIDYPIPSNDDATKTINLMLDYIQSAIEAGKKKVAKPVDKTEDKTVDSKPKTVEKETAETEEKPVEAKPEKPTKKAEAAPAESTEEKKGE